MDRLQFVVSVSEAHSRHNAGRTPDAALDELEAIVAGAPRRRAAGGHAGHGVRLPVRRPGAPPAPCSPRPSGRSPPGPSGVSLADTIGTAIPAEVTRLVVAATRLAGERPVGVHLHDTRGLGVANALAAIDAGAARIDGTVGGLGGCPFAPGASGNLALEDLVHVLEESGVDTGIDLEALDRRRPPRVRARRPTGREPPRQGRPPLPRSAGE